MRIPLLALATLASAPCLGQSPLGAQHSSPRPQARYAGVYHVASGTWTRKPAAAASRGSADVIYCNTANTGYFTSIPSTSPGSTVLDSGGLPGTTNGHPFPVAPNRDGYLVESFQIGYCDLSATPASSSWDISFYSSYVPCTGDVTPDAVVQLSGFPSNGCWIMDVDMTGATPICLGADGGEADPGWSDDVRRDSFGWGHQYTGTGTTAGFLLTGDPEATDPGWMPGEVPTAGNGTYFGPSGAAGNTGYLNTNEFALVDSTSLLTVGCFSFGAPSSNQPWAGFHMEIRADSAPCEVDQVGVGSVYCQSTVNSSGEIARTRILGSDLAEEDAVRLVADQMPTDAMGYFITSQMQGFTPNPGPYMGNLCLAGSIGRLAGAGQVKNSGADGEISILTSAGDWTLSAIPEVGGAYSAAAGMTTNVQAWFRDMSPTGGVTSNFSDGASVTWR